ncbi:Linear gramicidin synthase subunit B [compost metagenome]
MLGRVADHPNATLAEIASTEGSASARYLRKLAAGEADKSAPAEPLNGDAREANRGLLSPEHAQLAQIWADVIGIDVDEIRASDNFFDLGGDSLLVLRAVQQAAQTLGHRVEPRRYLFENLGQIASSAHGTPHGVPSDLADLAAGTAAHAQRGGLLGALGSWLRKG